jgi:uncharacterized repeat protein (TIGR03803 family)
MKILRISCVFLSFVLSLSGQTLTTLHTFDQVDGGRFPAAGLVQATNGDLYGTTSAGGDLDCEDGCGTIFKITVGGTLTTLHSFHYWTDGAYPTAGLIQAFNGNLYGTTPYGGIPDGTNPWGTVFKITPSGTLTTLHDLGGPNGPTGGLVQAINGNLYGTTVGLYNNYNNGTVFRITTGGIFTTLYSFDGTDGANSAAGLIQATDGNLYGTTLEGGTNGDGTVFKITPNGTLTTLHSFDGTDGEGPIAGLVQATNGDLYGTTNSGANCCGTVFKITLSGTFTSLYSFCAQPLCADGAGPNAALVQSTDGDLYGTTEGGGSWRGVGCAAGCGTIFKITLGGTLTILHSFILTDGSVPTGVVQDTNGDFYGTTTGGGANSVGTIFNLSMRLGPFVETQPTSGKVGAPVKILGTDLTGATSVTFNGTVATFTVVSKSEIKTTVPEGATTGKIDVKTPRSVLKSNVVFRVTK